MGDYPWGLGKDRRILTRYHSKEWMDYVISHQKPRFGEKNGHCKLSKEQVEFIRRDRDHTGPYLAKMFGVTKAHIYRIQKNRTRRRG